MKGRFSMKVMTPGMAEEGITSEEMEAVYQWGKELAKKLKEQK